MAATRKPVGWAMLEKEVAVFYLYITSVMCVFCRPQQRKLTPRPEPRLNRLRSTRLTHPAALNHLCSPIPPLSSGHIRDTPPGRPLWFTLRAAFMFH
jgi:hypothetical protein